MRIFTISGKAGSGKDTLARMLRKELENRGSRVLITHYADLLKYYCIEMFHWDGAKDEEGRSLLQHIGTDIVRHRNENYWVDHIIGMLSVFHDMWDYVIIPDARFPNEVDRLIDEGYMVTSIVVSREYGQPSMTDNQMNHESENAMNDYVFHCRFDNSGSIDDLLDAVRIALANPSGIFINSDNIFGRIYY